MKAALPSAKAAAAADPLAGAMSSGYFGASHWRIEHRYAASVMQPTANTESTVARMILRRARVCQSYCRIRRGDLGWQLGAGDLRHGGL